MAKIFPILLLLSLSACVPFSKVQLEYPTQFNSQDSRRPALNPSQEFYSGILPIATESGAGSGFVIHESLNYWYIGTALHVVLLAEDIWVNGKPAETINTDPCNDLAVLKVWKRPDDNYRVYKFAPAVQESSVKVVAWIFVNPEPLLVVFHGRVISTNWWGHIASNSNTWPGTSGGPLFDRLGRVVGVVNGVAVRRGIPGGIVICTPTHLLNELLDLKP